MADAKEGLIAKIREKSAALPLKQARAADYILKNYRELAYYTLSEMASAAGTGHGTVVRLAAALGYPSFSAMRDALRREIESAVQPTLRAFSSPLGDGAAIYDTVFEMEEEIMKDARGMIDEDGFKNAVRLLSDAPSVIVASAESNAFIGDYAAYFLSVLRPGIHNVKYAGMVERELINSQPEGAAALAVSLPRYPRAAQDLASLLAARGISLIGITDALDSPIAEMCSELFIVPQRYLSFIDPCAGVFSLLHSLLYGVYLSLGERNAARLKLYGESLKTVFVRGDVSAPG